MRAELTAFAASVFINVAAFATVDHAALIYRHGSDLTKQARAAAAKAGESVTQFDFVEVAPVTALREPLKNKKIAAHDSVAQDQSKAQDVPREAPPQIEKQGPADQLEQHRSENVSSPGSVASTPSIPQPPSPPSEQQAPQETVPKNAQDPSMEAPDPSEMVLQAPSKPRPPMLASPASSPSPRAIGQPARDRIDTPAVSRTRSHGAQVYGMTSFDATGSGMGKFMKSLKERIWLSWFPYVAFHYPKDFRTADAVVHFTLDAQGRVRSVQLVSSQGSAVFAAYCMEAVQRAAPFGELPPEVLDLIGKDELEVQFVFHFW